MPGAYTYIYTDILAYKFTLHPWPRIMNSAKRKSVSREPGCSHAVSGSKNEGVGNLAGCPNAVLGLPFLWVADNGAWAAQMQSPWCGCLKAVLQHRQWCNGHNTVRGPPLQTRVVAAYGTVSQLANMLVILVGSILAHMDMNRWQTKAK